MKVIRTPVVDTAHGPVRGQVCSGVRQFLGIPYAAPPVGPLRWRPPEPPVAWREPRDAVRFGSDCVQINTLGDFAATSSSEDCLYLNVFAPENAGLRKFPVMVWLPGGALFCGGGAPYDGSQLAAQGDVVFVSVNYRVNIFGFLAVSALDNEGHDFANYGFMDQQFALQWVRDNIAAFGGDPDNVTVFGESAGALSVQANLISTRASGLFHRAILQSSSYLPTVELSAAEAIGEEFVRVLGCDGRRSGETAEKLRSLSVRELQARAARFMAGLPVAIDGAVISESFDGAIEAGRFHRVPVINGTTRDEWRFLAAVYEIETGHVLAPDDYPSAIREGQGLSIGHGDSVPEILHEYPLQDFGGNTSLAYSALETDALFVLPSLEFDRALTHHGVPVYAYEFTDRSAPVYQRGVSFPYGAYHTGELQYLFAGYRGAMGTAHAMRPDQARLSRYMIRAWTSFAATGNPSPDGMSEWPSFRAGRYQSLGASGVVSLDLGELREDHHCGFWSSLSP